MREFDDERFDRSFERTSRYAVVVMVAYLVGWLSFLGFLIWAGIQLVQHYT